MAWILSAVTSVPPSMPARTRSPSRLPVTTASRSASTVGIRVVQCPRTTCAGRTGISLPRPFAYTAAGCLVPIGFHLLTPARPWAIYSLHLQYPGDNRVRLSILVIPLAVRRMASHCPAIALPVSVQPAVLERDAGYSATRMYVLISAYPRRLDFISANAKHVQLAAGYCASVTLCTVERRDG